MTSNRFYRNNIRLEANAWLKYPEGLYRSDRGKHLLFNLSQDKDRRKRARLLEAKVQFLSIGQNNCLNSGQA